MFNLAVLSLVVLCACVWHWAGTRLLRAAVPESETNASDAEEPRGIALRMAVLALYKAAWAGEICLLAAAALSVADVIIAVPLSLAGIAAVLAQASAAALASVTARIPAGHPARAPARAAFGAIVIIGLALPVIVLLMAAAMIGPELAMSGA
ncbi:MAG: hypothetical protein HRF49_07325 [bacterium]|jgi:hypothetical protein